MELHLNLRTSATRSTLLHTALHAMTPEQVEQFNDLLEQAVVPDKHHKTLAEVNDTIRTLHLPDAVKVHMYKVYEILATAEATVHGCTLEQTHFHEVGNATGIRNALSICIALFVLQPKRITATPIQTGSGEVECAHGTLSIPAPATKAILEGLPLATPCLEGELCTPTSAALIKHFVDAFEEQHYALV